MLQVFIAEQEVEGGNAAGNIPSFFFCVADQVQAFLGGDTGDVQLRLGIAKQVEVAFDHDFFCEGGDTGESHAGRDDAFVHESVGSDAFIDGQLDNNTGESFYILEGFEEESGLLNGGKAIGESDSAAVVHIIHFGEVLALAALGDGT